jgi:hypothetical protein
MHYWSHDSKGFSDTPKGNLEWDEAVTDFLARRVWFFMAVDKQPYKTSYGNLSDFMKAALDKLFICKFKEDDEDLMFNITTLRQTNVVEFKSAFNDLGDNEKLKIGYRAEMQSALSFRFLTWYTSGPLFKILESDFSDFALNEDSALSNALFRNTRMGGNTVRDSKLNSQSMVEHVTDVV